MRDVLGDLDNFLSVSVNFSGISSFSFVVSFVTVGSSFERLPSWSTGDLSFLLGDRSSLCLRSLDRDLDSLERLGGDLLRSRDLDLRRRLSRSNLLEDECKRRRSN